MKYDRRRALELLRSGCGKPQARFHDGQEEAIRHIVEGGGRALVVQRTGWGKSFVYFIAAKLLREGGEGPALLVSPLLALMRNQIAAAERMGARALTLHSQNKDEWADIAAQTLSGKTDILIVSPERFANEEFKETILNPIAGRVSLLVIDEAHCISDWGHDFRPHYRMLAHIIEGLPRNLRLLATTATANNRVINDLRDTLGGIEVLRGDIARTSLTLQTIQMPGQAQRLAWLAQRLGELKGSGIVYALTVRDAELVAAWLRHCGFAAQAYTSEAAEREELEQALLNNDIKALAATTALGMGFDKPDLAFVIHYQSPGSVIAYYQQIGRAGRELANAHCVLLRGAEDDDINNYFINNAFPSREDAESVVGELRNSEDGLTIYELEARMNIRRSRLDKILFLLSIESPAPIVKNGARWQLTASPLSESFWRRVEGVTALRREEQKQMRDYAALREGHMRFLVGALDGDTNTVAEPPAQPLPQTADAAMIEKAAAFLKQDANAVIHPRKRWPAAMMASPTIPKHEQAQPGRVLCDWGDGGWFPLVQQGKYKDGAYGRELVGACLRLIEKWKPQPRPSWMTCAPSSQHSNALADFARQLAAELGVEFRVVLEKTKQTPPQKAMQNSAKQARNAVDSIGVCGAVPDGAVFLVDDIVDSRWTLTVASHLLLTNGAGAVFPLALANAEGRR